MSLPRPDSHKVTYYAKGLISDGGVVGVDFDLDALIQPDIIRVWGGILPCGRGFSE